MSAIGSDSTLAPSPPPLTPHQAKYFAHELARSYASDHVGKLAGLLFDAQVEPKPHQIDAALFALQTPFLNGVILADEVGLGKTIEAGIVIAQSWAERKRRILIIVPSSLRQQWQQELLEKFFIPSFVVGSASAAQTFANPKPPVLIVSYEFAHRHAVRLTQPWDLVVVDEAHRLRNFYTGKAKVATAVARVLEGAERAVLLTATPLQNRLEELYGLVSTFQPDYFFSLDAFRERYIKNRDNEFDDLPDRVAQIAKRTLRRDADKYIRFTARRPLTVEFEPSREEQLLYEKVNDYLQRDKLYAFPKSQRHLAALIIRKRLGSSTYAVASTLGRVADRLEAEVGSGKRRDNRGGFLLDEDMTSEEIEDSEDEETPDAQPNPHSAKALTEVAELREYAALARSITVNRKAVKLEEALTKGFAMLAEIGAPRKAIIFTDSTKTQEYIAATLKASGRGEGLVLFNGTNDSPEAAAIYQEWLASHRGSDIVTGIAAADRRKALVDYFRITGSIMVATEAAAEGINLQFCSMVVNYDLPWNPQRVEQRIGRCHRYGQQHDVVVVNFSNKGNLAEQRILELLTEKFHLFESVFGTSDEVLGRIEDGLDFEKRIASILNSCRTAKEIEAALNRLEAEFSAEISKQLAAARTKVFDNLDPHVQDRLKTYDRESTEVLNRFERLLLALTRDRLAGMARFQGDGRVFDLDRSPVTGAPTGRYHFKSHPTERSHQYRYSGPLAQHVVQTSLEADTPPEELVFSLSASERVSSRMKSLAGQSGALTVSQVAFRLQIGKQDLSESYLIASGLTDSGQPLDQEDVAEMMDLTCVRTRPAPGLDPARFAEDMAAQEQHWRQDVQTRNSRFYDRQEEALYRSAQDRRAESEAKIREYRQKEKELRKEARQAPDPLEQLRLKKEARRWSQRAEDEDERSRRERDYLRHEADDALDLIEQALQAASQVQPLFTIRWAVTQ